MEETKRCPKCGTTKPRSDFSISPARYDGLASYCRPCMSEYVSKYTACGVRTWRKDPANRVKQYAWELVKKAVLKGEIERPDVCEKCGASVRLHAHHDDYSKPLDVAFLCPRCHKDRHRVLQTLK